MPNFAVSDLSMGDRTQLLSRALDVHLGSSNYCYIRDVYETFVVYRDWDEDATYQIDYTIDDATYAVTWGDPVEVIERTLYEPVQMSAFSLPAKFTASGKFNVYPESLLFEIKGKSEYFPNQQMTVTEEDLHDIVASFTGATMGLEHEETVLGDNCGRVQDVWLDETGRKLFGTVAIPKGLDELIPANEPRRVSVEIFRNQDTGKLYIPKVDLVLNPQIERAALMSIASFAKGDQPTRPAPANPSARQGKETKRMSTWDKVKAAFKSVGLNFDEEQPESGDADTKRKAAAYDAGVKARREQAKADAVTAFGKDKAAEEAAIIDALPDGEALNRYADRMAAEAQKFRGGGAEGGQRRTAAAGFATDADRQPAGQFKSQAADFSATDVYASRAKAMGRDH
jgi:hypothetical protein